MNVFPNLQWPGFPFLVLIELASVKGLSALLTPLPARAGEDAGPWRHQEPARAHRNKSATAALCDRNKTATAPLIGRC